jgi:large subunit ribosomal protein L4
VGGGTVFGPIPRSYEMKVNKKTRRAALCAALSRRQEEQSPRRASTTSTLSAIKTKGVVDVLMHGSMSNRALIIDGDNRNAGRQRAQHPPPPTTSRSHGLNVYDILRHDTVLVTRCRRWTRSTTRLG